MPESEIPTAPGWIVIEKLGEGGFGEVWKGTKDKRYRRCIGDISTGTDNLKSYKIGQTAAFKFCFDLAHARALTS